MHNMNTKKPVSDIEDPKQTRHIVTWSPEEDDILRDQIRNHGTDKILLQSGVLSMGNKQSGSWSQQQQHGYMPPSFPGSTSSTHSYYSGTYSQSISQSHSRYTRIGDDYSSLEQVTTSLGHSSTLVMV